MSAHENAVQALIIGGYGERQARELLSHVRGEAWNDGYNRSAMVTVGAEPLVVSRFDVAMEPAIEEEQVLTVGCIAAGGRPVALLLDAGDRAKVAGWLAPELPRLWDRVAELEKGTVPAATSTPAEHLIYRAEYEHEAIPLGLYTTLAAARAHCEGQLSSEYPSTVTLVHDWIGDEDDPEQPWELVAFIDGAPEQLTGYVVTTLTVATEYDPEAEG